MMFDIKGFMKGTPGKMLILIIYYNISLIKIIKRLIVEDDKLAMIIICQVETRWLT